MRNRIYRFFKRLKLRFYIWSKKRHLIPSYEENKTSYEKTCFLICLKVIKHKNTKLMIAPVSNKRFIENKDMNIFIALDDRVINLNNHVYPYSVKLTTRDWERIIYVFELEVERRILGYEEEINSQIKDSLHDVLKRVSNFK